VKSKKYQVSLSPKISEFLEHLAEEKGITKSAIIALALEKYMREEGGNERK